MTNRVCRDTRREIDESELHQALSDNAVMHLQICSSCRDFREERTRLRDLVGSLEPVRAPADFDFRLHARLAAQRQSTRQGLFSGFRFTMPAKIAVAVLVMLVASLVWINQRTGTHPSVANVAQPNNSSASNSSANQSAVPTSPEADRNKPDGTDEIAQTAGAAFGRKPIRLSSRTRGGRSTDFNETAAESVRGIDDAGEVSLAAPVRPLVVSMEDDRGATRTISLPPVSFGSQRLVDNRIPVSSANRVW